MKMAGRGWIIGCLLFVLCFLPAFADKPNGLVILLDDYGTQDFYVGAIKGAIYDKFLGVNVDEISSDVPAWNIREASYILAHAAREFPAGTVFCVAMQPEMSGHYRYVAVETQDVKFYVAPDDGVLTSVMRQSKIKEAREIANPLFLRDANSLSSFFPGRDVYGPAAASLANGLSLTEIGPPAKDLVTYPITEPKFEVGQLTGEIEHVSAAGNILTNIPQDFAAKLGVVPGKFLKIDIGAEVLEAPFVKSYNDVGQGSWAILINSFGNLEITRNQASANAIVQARVGAVVKVRPYK